MPPTDTSRLSPAEAARRLGVDVGTLRRWESEGKITSARTVGGHRRYPVSEIERIEASPLPEPAEVAS